MVEVFKTNIEETEQAQEIVSALQQYFPGSRVTIDLDDCDKVLRINHTMVQPKEVIQLVSAKGFECSMLQ